MTLTLVFRRTENGKYAAYIEEMPELLIVRGNDLEQVRLDVFVEMAQMLNYRADDEEVTLVTKHWLNYPMPDNWYTQEEDWDRE